MTRKEIQSAWNSIALAVENVISERKLRKGTTVKTFIKQYAGPLQGGRRQARALAVYDALGMNEVVQKLQEMLSKE